MNNLEENNYRKVEGMLYSYPKVKVEIENIKLDIEELNDVVGIRGISNGPRGSTPTYRVSSKVENEVIDRDENLPERIANLNRILRQKERYIKKIDNILSLLKEDERKLIELIYFKKYTLEKTGEVFGITKDGVSKRRKPIILEIIRII